MVRKILDDKANKKKPGPLKRKTVQKKPHTPESLSAVLPEERHELIAKAAYFRSEQRGFVPGAELDDWLAAEAEILGLLGEEDAGRQ